MYKIRGADGKEYGPVSTDTLRDWVNQGRANGQTFVLPDGATEWRTLSTCPEFADIFATLSAATTGTVGAAPAGPAKTSSMAIWSLVLGISGFVCGLTAIPGLILGIIAMKQIRESMGRLSGRGLALAGTITSAVALLMLPVVFLAAMLLPALSKAKSRAQSINCVNNVKHLALGVRIYSTDNNGLLPSGTNWCDAINQTVGSPRVYQCPSDMAHLRSGYAYNSKLSGLAEKDVDPQTVMVFESDADWNASGGRELMITKPRHAGRYVVAHADGSVEQVTAARLKELRWDPQPGPNNASP